MRRRWCSSAGLVGTIALAAATLPGCAQAQAVERGSQPLTLGGLRIALGAETKVGSKRAGLICAPAGALRWRDVEPELAAARIAMTRAMKEAGAAIDGPTDDWLDYRASATGFRLVGAVTGLEMRACVPSYGLARVVDGHHRLKGGGTLAMEWRVYRLSDRQIVAATRSCAAFAFDESGRTLADATLLGVVENARLVARELARMAAALSLPARLGLPESQCTLNADQRITDPRRGDLGD